MYLCIIGEQPKGPAHQIHGEEEWDDACFCSTEFDFEGMMYKVDYFLKDKIIEEGLCKD